MPEYKNPILKNPKFGWQTYQFGNKPIQALKNEICEVPVPEPLVLTFSSTNVSDVIQASQVAPIYELRINIGFITDDFGYQTFNYKSYNNPEFGSAIFSNAVQLTEALNEYYNNLGIFSFVSGEILLSTTSNIASGTIDVMEISYSNA
jgi:hypothetical protein